MNAAAPRPAPAIARTAWVVLGLMLLLGLFMALRPGHAAAVAIGTYDQCSNDQGTGYPSGDDGCRWINGNLQSNNSTYFEGDATVQRVWLTDLAPGSTHTITLKYGTTKGGKHAYDFLTTWDWSESWITVADRCQAITGCTTAGETGLDIPQDPNVPNSFEPSAPGARQFRMRGGTLDSATTPAITSGTYTGDSETVITVSFTVAGSGPMCANGACAVALWFGAHVSTQVDWGLGNGAGAIPGSPYHVALDLLDGDAVGQRDNQMQATAVVPNGTVTIVKDAVPNAAQDFSFNLTNGGTISQSFSLDDDGDPVLPNSQTFSVPPGTWTAGELNIPAGWNLTNLACQDPTGNTTTSGAVATIDLASAETVTCTYTNTNQGTVIIDKVTDPAGDPTSFGFTTTLPGGGFSLTDQAQPRSVAVTPGTYQVAETTPAGWDLTSATCSDDSPVSAISVQPGETVTCTFTNTRQGSITLVKQTLPDGDPATFTFTGDLAGTIGDNGTITKPVAPGTYTATEAAKTGWDLTGLSCTDTDSTGDTATRTATFKVGAGENVTCTFTNTKRGQIQVVKTTNPGGDPQAFTFTPSDWPEFTRADGQPAWGSLLLAPGTYSVAELAQPGWDLTSATCSDGSPVGAISLQPGETILCTFTNTKRASLTVVKQTLPDGAAQAFDFTAAAPLDPSGFSLSDGQSRTFTGLVPGSYDVAEAATTGWDLTGITCDDTDSTGDTATGTATFKVSAGEHVTCTFTNTQRGKVIVKKVTDPAGDPTAFGFTASYDQAGFSLSDGQSNDSGALVPGTYSVAETTPAGWDLASATCNDGSPVGAIAVGPGETVTCTFTNAKWGAIKLVKQTVPAADPIAQFTFTGDLAGSVGDGGSITKGVAPGTYTTTEALKSGWDLTGVTCDDGDSTGDRFTRTATFRVAAGETVTCTFTNTARGQIIVRKQTDPADDPQSFDFTSDFSQGFSLTDNGIKASTALMPGTYAVAETPTPGWDLTSATCSDGSPVDAISLQPNETVTCTFTNTKRATIIVTKQTVPDGATQAFGFTASYDQAGFSLTDGQSNDSGTLVPGTYAVAENTPAGWDLTGTTCDDDSPVGAIQVSAGEVVRCTFTNSRRPTLQIDKVFVGAPDGANVNVSATKQGAQDPEVTGTLSAPSDTTGTRVLSGPGGYQVAEASGTADLAHYVSSVACTVNGQAVDLPPSATTSAGLTLAYGDQAVCTFTNRRKPQITLVKKLVPASDPGTFDLVASQDGTPVVSAPGVGDGGGVGPADLPGAGTYTVAEQGANGTDLAKYASQLVCVNQNQPQAFATDTAPVGDGATATQIEATWGDDWLCTFTNTRRPGQLELKKALVPTTDPGRFTLRIATGGATLFSTADVGDGGTTGTQQVVPGAYTVSEVAGTTTDLTKYDQALQCRAAGGTGAVVPSPGGVVSVDSGDDIVCTITNTRRPGQIEVRKDLEPDADPGRFTLSIAGAGGPVASAADQGNGGTTGKQSVAPGTYTVAEAAGTATSAADYASSLRCVAQNGAGPEVPSAGGQVAVDSGDDIVCVFTNTRNPVPPPPAPPAAPAGQPATTPVVPVATVTPKAPKATRARLAIDKRAPARVSAGQVVTYAITVRNTSRVLARGVVITDTVPAQMTLAGRARGVRVAGGTVTWRAGNLRPGASRTVTLQLRLDTGARTTRCNVAAARAANAAQVRDRACSRVTPIANRVEPAVTG